MAIRRRPDAPPTPTDHAAITGRGGRGDRGVTTIEVLVLVTVVGILVAIGLPTWRSAQVRGHDADTKAELRTALLAAHSIFDRTHSYAAADGEGLARAGVPLRVVPADRVPVGRGTVSVLAEDGVWVAAARSASGTCFWLRSEVAGSTLFGSTDDTLSCTGRTAGAAGRTAW